MKSSSQPLLLFFALVLGAAVLQQVMQNTRPDRPHMPQPLPPLMVQGWLNTDQPPTRESLSGKWVALSLWSLNCRTCRYEAPKLVRLHRAITERDDIVLIGFDTDSSDGPAAIEQYLATVPGYDWPVGHGARPMEEVLGARGWPSLYLFGPDGQSVWNGHFVERLAEQLKDRLGVDSVQFEG